MDATCDADSLNDTLVASLPVLLSLSDPVEVSTSSAGWKRRVGQLLIGSEKEAKSASQTVGERLSSRAESVEKLLNVLSDALMGRTGARKVNSPGDRVANLQQHVKALSASIVDLRNMMVTFMGKN